jgi:hypothetical protein
VNGTTPAGRSGLWRAMWRRFLARQHLIGYPAAVSAVHAILLLSLAVSLGHASSFSAYARAVYHENDLLADAWDRVAAPRVSIWFGLALLVVGQAVVEAWLRPGFLRGLIGEGATLRPPRYLAVRIGLYSLAFDGLSVADSGVAELSGAVALLLYLVLTALFLYGDYAIVVDDVGVVEGVRRSLRVARATLWPTLLVVIVGELVILPLLIGAFGSGFDDTSYVFPPYLLAYVLAGAVLQYALDVALITIYTSVPTAVRSG